MTGPPETDPRALASGPYRTPGRLGARSAIYVHQRPRVDLVGVATQALADLEAGAVLVDVGCGPGTYLRRMRPDLRLVGVDVSLGMLRAVEDRAARVAGSADALPLRSGSADAALAMHMLYHLRTPDEGLRELRRVLRPGGRLVVSTNDETPDGLWQLFLDAGLPRPPVGARWPLAGARDALEAAGFTGVREQVFDYVLDIPSAGPVLDYLDSVGGSGRVRRNLAAAVGERIERHGFLRRTGRVGILTARS